MFKVCDAIGRVYIANVTNSVLARVQQARAYGSAIVAVKESLQDPQQFATRETLVSVLLLCIYEVLLCGCRLRHVTDSLCLSSFFLPPIVLQYLRLRPGPFTPGAW